MTPEALLAHVTSQLRGATALPLQDTRGQAVVVVDRDHLTAALRFLRDDPQVVCDLLADLSAVDYLGRTPRFEVVYQLKSVTQGHRLRVKVPVDESDPAVPTATTLWRSALWAEREVWDMFGIRFTGHPDLRRILMYPEFEGHPLRKDFPLNARQPLEPERDPIQQPWFPESRS